MLYIGTLILGFALVAGSLLWKLAVERLDFEISTDFFFSRRVLEFVFSPYILGGLVVYGFATLLNLWLFSRYDFSAVQIIIIPLTLVLSILAGKLFFDDQLSLINFIGILVIAGGVVLATLK